MKHICNLKMLEKRKKNDQLSVQQTDSTLYSLQL